jgi:chemotaxis protein MotB
MPEEVIHLDSSEINMSNESRIAWKTILVAVVATAAAAGIGYYAWNLRSDHLATVDELEVAKVQAAQFNETNTKLAACQTAKDEQSERCAAVENSVADMQGNLSATRAELDSLRQQREQTAKRLAAFKELTDKLKKMIDSGKLDVIIRDGRMVVKLPAGVLFDSGSAKLSRSGELALMEVAIVLRTFKDRKFVVEGHTDNRPLESAQATTRYRNNWELSAGRAVTVIQFLIEARMKPENLLAAGHGEFDPVGDNNTSAGRQENRRIEIVLLPNVEELPAFPDESAKPQE